MSLAFLLYFLGRFSADCGGSRMNVSMQNVLILATSFLLYIRIFSAEFAYDDHHAIVHNPDVRGECTLMDILYHDFWGTLLDSDMSHKSWRPLTTLLFRGLYSISCMSATLFHILPVVLNSVCCVLVHRFACAIGLQPSAAMIATVLFLTHPAHVGT